MDIEAFEEAAATARHAMEPQAFGAAIDLYAGELLPEDRYEAWTEERRAQLQELYLSLLTELAALLEERGEYEAATEALGRAVAEEPTREAAHEGLMRLYALSGRRREALSQYERLREVLSDDLGMGPGTEITRLQQEIWIGDFPVEEDFRSGAVPVSATAGKHNLPLSRTSFVGREREVLEVKRHLAMTSLLTLTGAGGCGKTRLALEAARDLVGAYPDGVWLVELAALSEPALVAQAVAQAVGVRERPGSPSPRRSLSSCERGSCSLVLDNCEHLVGAVAGLIDALLDHCPRLRVLATSRERLNAAGRGRLGRAFPDGAGCRTPGPGGTLSPGSSRLTSRLGSSCSGPDSAIRPSSWTWPTGRQSHRYAGAWRAYRTPSSLPPRARGCSPHGNSRTGSKIPLSC